MNIKFEGNINFSEELLNLVCENKKIDDNFCLISRTQLKEDHIKLVCGHKFNYSDLLNEIINQKKLNHFEVQKLKKTQIKCPYCRNIQNKLLPYNEKYKKMKNVNWSGDTKINKHCIAVIKSGKRKGELCGCNAKYGEYCGRHKKK
jgi:hypothetical protein